MKYYLTYTDQSGSYVETSADYSFSQAFDAQASLKGEGCNDVQIHSEDVEA